MMCVSFCELLTPSIVFFHKLPCLAPWGSANCFISLTAQIVLTFHQIESLWSPRKTSLESKLGFQQLFLFYNLLYIIQFRFIGLPDKMLIQKHKSKAGTMLSITRAQSVTYPHLHSGLTPLVYHPLALFPRSSSHPLCYQKNMLDENLTKYDPPLAKYTCVLNMCSEKKQAELISHLPQWHHIWSP